MANANFFWETQRNLYSTDLRWGFAFVETQTLCFASGVRQILAFLDTNMLVSPTQIFTLGEPTNAKICIGPNASNFASQWNIGFNGSLSKPLSYFCTVYTISDYDGRLK